MSMNKILIAVAVVVVIAIISTISQTNKYEEFMKTAKKTMGRISKKEERIADPKTKRTEYWVTYSYTDEEKRQYSSLSNLEYPDIYGRLREGSVVEVYYDPKNPAISYMAPVLERRLAVGGKK